MSDACGDSCLNRLLMIEWWVWSNYKHMIIIIIIYI